MNISLERTGVLILQENSGVTHGLGYIQIDVGVRAVCISLLAHADWEPFSDQSGVRERSCF